MNILRTIWFWLMFFLTLPLWWLILEIVNIFDRKDKTRYKTGYVFRHVGKFLVKLSFQKLGIYGAMPENTRKPYVFVSNHQSIVDIPLISCLPWEMKWIAKAELFSLPFLGRMMKLSRDIPVDRKDKSSRLRAFNLAGSYLEKKVPVFFFPEGTRSSSGKILRFSDGAFALAIDKKVDILPIAIDGSSKLIAKKRFLFGKVDEIKLALLEPISIGKVLEKKMTARDVSSLARDRIVSQVAEWRNVPKSEVDIYSS